MSGSYSTALADGLMNGLNGLVNHLDGLSKELEKVNDARVRTKIRVTFNRKLTYSEREQMRVDINSTDGWRGWFTEPDKIYVENVDDDDSRGVFEDVSFYVETRFVNVHPVAVRTFTPEVKV